MMILRPDTRILTIPGGLAGIEFIQHMTQSGGGDWWDPDGSGLSCLGAWQAKGAASYAASLVDLSGEGNDLATYDSNDPSWNTSTGWTFDGVDDQLNMPFNWEAGDAWTVIIRYAGSSGPAVKCLCGVNQSGTAMDYGIYPYYALGTGRLYQMGTGGGNSGGSYASSGVIAVAGLTGYHDGSEDATISNGWTGTGGKTLAFGGRRNYSGGILEAWDGDIIAAAAYDETVGSSDIAAITTAMENL